MKIKPSSSQQENEAFIDALKRVLKSPHLPIQTVKAKKGQSEKQSAGIPSAKAPSTGGASR